MANTGTKTQIFHGITTSHKRFISMDQLEMDGATIKDHEMVKEAVQKFYKNL